MGIGSPLHRRAPGRVAQAILIAITVAIGNYTAIHHPEQASNDLRNDEDPARSCDRTGSRHHS
ncbi:hypothetical protein OG242_12660 [Streptomyces sp. NBC_00727]|uniref:hypothetical protein n=1 Tax=Streptomyces sp. NBC_00727 TaxID=2903675 RepID=UPI003864BD54